MCDEATALHSYSIDWTVIHTKPGLLSVLGTIKTGDPHSATAGSATPASCILSISLCSRFLCLSPACYGTECMYGA